MSAVTFSTAILSLLFVQSAFAQTSESGSVTTQSGSTVETQERTTHDIINDIRALAPERTPAKLRDVTVPEIKVNAWLKESTAARERLAQHRRDCREAIRKANRDQLLNRMTTCHRSDLLQEVNLLRKQAAYVASIPLLDAAVQAAFAQSVTALTDAQMAIVDAIDAGLFESAEGMEEAKRNLRINYREPQWLRLVRIHADRELTFIIYMLKNIEDRLAEPDLPSDRLGLLTEATQCLETASFGVMQSREATDRSAAGAALAEARAQLETCRSHLRKVAQKERLADAESQ